MKWLDEKQDIDGFQDVLLLIYDYLKKKHPIIDCGKMLTGQRFDSLDQKTMIKKRWKDMISVLWILPYR